MASGSTFPCTRCGSCCKSSVALDAVLGTDWPRREDGACGFLTADGLCATYETRPEACVIRIPHGESEAEHFAAQADACAALQRHFGMDPAVWKPVLT